jgi:hypothetical protein
MRKLWPISLLLTSLGCGALVDASDPCIAEWRAGRACEGTESLHSQEWSTESGEGQGEQRPAGPAADAGTPEGGTDGASGSPAADAGVAVDPDVGDDDAGDVGDPGEEPECWEDGAPSAPGTPCGDGSFCGGQRACDGYGECALVQDRCSDPRFPSCNEATDSCACTIGSCGADGECFAGACEYFKVFRVEDVEDDAYQRGNDVFVEDERYQLDSGEVAGFRFAGITVAPDEDIVSARLEVGAPASPSPDVCMDGAISAERTLAADPFSDVMPLVDRDRTATSVRWDVCDHGGPMLSPDVGPLLNELRGTEGELDDAEIALLYDHAGDASTVELFGAGFWGVICGEYCNPKLKLRTRVEGYAWIPID